jgi:hypothetical protein
MRADIITICEDNPTNPDGYTAHTFTAATYTREWNGIRVTPASGDEQFFDNLVVVDFQTFTAATKAA